MKILALDLGKYNTMCCFFDTKTRNYTFQSATTDRRYLSTVFKQHPVDLVVMEACGPSGWINDLATSMGLKTLVCSTNEEAWKWSNVKRKTDKDDALKLARMAAMGELKAVHMPSEEHREFRTLVKYRKTLDWRINKMKCTIRAWFVNHGIWIDKGSKAWHAGRELINSHRKPIAECSSNELWRGELDIELTQLDSLTKQLEEVIKRLEVIGQQDPRIVRLRTIPGVGPRTAEILVACIDDPHRFANGRQVSAYFGLVPRQYQSGETDRNGRITKRGNPLARTILVECAWVSLRYNPWAKGVYQRICGNQKTRKKKAGVALARKLAVIAWAMLRDEKDWDPATMIRITEAFGGTLPLDKESFQAHNPKKNKAQPTSGKGRQTSPAASLASGRRNGKQTPALPVDKPSTHKVKPQRKLASSSTAPSPARPSTQRHEPQSTKTKPTTKAGIQPANRSKAKPRRARKPVGQSDVGALRASRDRENESALLTT